MILKVTLVAMQHCNGIAKFSAADLQFFFRLGQLILPYRGVISWWPAACCGGGVTYGLITHYLYLM